MARGCASIMGIPRPWHQVKHDCTLCLKFSGGSTLFCLHDHAVVDY